jgi:hypothetical protein
MSSHPSQPDFPTATKLRLVAGLAFLLGITACSGDDGSDGAQGPPGPSDPLSTQLEQGDDLPGLNVEIVGLSGGTGAGGSFKVGDRITVRFTLERNDGSTWPLSELSSGRVMVSGPTFNYQRVLPEKNDVLTRAVAFADGSYGYTFVDPIPAVYAPPINDTASFGIEDGDLGGQPLLNGTYTVGLYATWNFTVEEDGFRDADNATKDFLIGAGVLEPRAVVAQDNCNQCHESLRIHGGMRRDVGLCVLCHTAGAEDKNDPAVAGGTPGVSIDFRVMIHRIHNGAHLPSVLGVTTNNDGSRKYDATPQPYLVVGNSNSIHDYSDVQFPVWPSLTVAMPRDQGYTALSTAAKALEDTIRMGVVSCAKCHGDPDGAGPIAAPAQGDLHKAQPSRQSCGSCHDDVVWGHLYTSNGQTMGAQADNANCKLCHDPSGTPIAVEDAHRHPATDPAFNAGLVVDVDTVVESGTNNGDGTVDPGEKIAVTFSLTDDAGAPVSPSVSTSYSVVVSGPTSNLNLLLSSSIPAGALTGAQPYTVKLPEVIVLDFAGDATGATGEVFTTSRTPLWNMTGATTSVFVRTGIGGGSTVLAEDAGAFQNYVDVANAAGFARDEYVMLEHGVLGSEEYLRIQYVDGNRLWFGSLGGSTYAPGTRVPHFAGASIQEVTLTSKTVGTDYTVNAAAGTITEVTEFGAGNAVLVTYTTDFVMPSAYPVSLNESPDIDESWGDWRGKPIADGTYLVGIWGSRNLTLNLFGESNNYRGTAVAEQMEFLVGSASTVEPYGLISDGASCNSCHSDVQFHGSGRRGFDTCVMCHGAPGAEDRPRYVAANAPLTTATTINFRTMLHKIHMGEELSNPTQFVVNGFGSGSYPNNFTSHTYGEVVFPAMPGAVANCTTCHGASNTAWHEPASRNHPTDQGLSARTWRATCGACHDSAAAAAHIDVQTSPGGVESCAVCHGDGSEWNVHRMHKTY